MTTIDWNIGIDDQIAQSDQMANQPVRSVARLSSQRLTPIGV